MNPKTKIALWVGVWALTRILMIALVGFWHPDGAHYQDVDLYATWSQQMADSGEIPNLDLWQYPPGAAYLMLIPRLSPEAFQPTFMSMMLVFDFIGLCLMVRFAGEEQRDTGVWIWLLLLPLLATAVGQGGMPLLRFDLVPTVAAMAGLLVIHRRPAMFGALAGIGASIKVWPILLLFGEWDRKRLLTSALAALAGIAAIFAITALVLGDPFGFLDDQGGRGLQWESIGTLPWKLREAITGHAPPLEARFGSNEIASGLGDATARVLDVAALLMLAGAGILWWLRDRGIRAGRHELEDVALSRDFVFTVSLLFVVISRVLSPQYMIWLVGLAAIVLTSRRTRIGRAAWLAVAAIVLTAGVDPNSGISLVVRNLVLLAAALDAAISLSLVFTSTRSAKVPPSGWASPRDSSFRSGLPSGSSPVP
jgi:hypothetical protein